MNAFSAHMTVKEQRVSKLIERIGPVLFFLPLATQSFNCLTFINHPTSVTFVFSIMPNFIQKSFFCKILFLLFEYWSKVLFVTGSVWLIQLHILPTGLLSLWGLTLMSNQKSSINDHIAYHNLLRTAVAQVNAMVGEIFLPVVIASMGSNCVILMFCSIKFHGKVDSSSYMFFLSSTVLTLGINQALVYVNGSIYDVSRKYLKLIRRSMPVDRGYSSKLLWKVVNSLRHSGVPLGPLPCAKSEYAIRSSYEIFNNVVNLLIAF